MSLSDEARMLTETPLFAHVDPQKLKLLTLASERLTFRREQVLCKEGDEGRHAFVILAGTADVFVANEDGETRIAEVGKHDIVGEIAILCDMPRTATVRASSETVDVLRISKGDFLTMMQDFPDMALVVMRHLAERLSRTTHDLAIARDALKNKL